MALNLRVCPGSFCGLAELSDHEADGGPVEEGQGLSAVAFPVLGEAAAAVQPSEGSLDDPAFG